MGEVAAKPTKGVAAADTEPGVTPSVACGATTPAA
jgi:hypothetical protein